MATCKDCLHYCVCTFHITENEYKRCPHYATTADVVKVVRCKDCIHSSNMPLGLCYLHTEPYDNERGYKGEAVCVEPDDFCSYGKRKEGE